MVLIKMKTVAAIFYLTRSSIRRMDRFHKNAAVAYEAFDGHKDKRCLGIGGIRNEATA